MAARSTKSLCDVHATAPVRDFLKPSEVTADMIFSPDSILDVVGCSIPDILNSQDLWQSPEALKKYILQKVSEAYDVLLARHIKTYHYYIHIATRETRVPPEVMSHALGTAIFARDLLVEGAMARRYFTYMFQDLKKSEDAADMYAVKVPSPTATLIDLDDQTIERTYYSAFPAFLRSISNKHAPTRQRDSLADLAGDLSSMNLEPSTSSSRSVMVG